MREKEGVCSCHHMTWCGNMYQTVMYQYLGAYNPLSLSLNKRDALSFGEVKQSCFAEAFCRERISPLMRCRGIFPLLFPQFSPNISFILPVLCWPCHAEPVQSLSLDTERAQKKFLPPILWQPKSCTHSRGRNTFLKKKEVKNNFTTHNTSACVRIESVTKLQLEKLLAFLRARRNFQTHKEQNVSFKYLQTQQHRKGRNVQYLFLFCTWEKSMQWSNNMLRMTFRI